ncbi:uncharacterized protein F5Z01DRAFT_676216 [Emericellopsis atlantica]|uniref:Uncharacterized protein n=1 Tax=Emericellopsis atlantica TaxID=2614577 RepID=A0A9P7ZIC9_9HYPO|nr:uncharacterized protein F5Z01DRAFT_676216 [Emericellopsis atlantica]KAG9252337.1 hypothetical protein F5Z01DRAFT_676216 [Emericellopsis atlantica]
MAGQQPTQKQEEEPHTYKEQLDRVAEEKRKAQHPQQPNPIVEKSKSSLSFPAKYILGNSKQEPATTKSEDIRGPPERPHHDHKIEDFVRDQHRSKTDSGKIKADANA